MNIIDALVVKLSLDSSDLSKKSGAASKTLKGLEEQGGKTEGEVKKIGKTSKESASGVGELGAAVGKLLAVLGGAYAIKAFIEDTIQSSAALSRLSKNLGLNVQDVSAWGNAVEELGGSAKGLQGTMAMLSQQQTQLRLTGESSLIPYFSALGVAMAGVGGQARPVNEILLDLAERFSHMDRTTANNMGKMMGLDQDTLNLLLKGRGEVELMIKRQKEYNAVTKEQAEQSAKLQKQMIDLKQSFTALGRNLLQEASPAIEKFLGVLTGLGNWLRANGEFIGDLAKILGTVAAGLALIGVASSPLTLVIGGVMLLAAAIALLWQDYQTWKRGGDSLIDWEKWKPGIDKAIAGIKDMGKALKDVADSIMIVKQGLSGDSTGANAASEKLHDKMMVQLGFKPGSAPIPDAFSNIFRSQDNQIPILDGTQAATSGRVSVPKKGERVTSAYAMQYFMDRGMSKEEAAALASQVNSESNGDPNAVGDGGKAYGLIQWHKDRQDAFRAWKGRAIQGSSGDDQLEFMVHELMSGTERAAQKKIASAGSAQEAGALASELYVRPADRAGQATTRGNYAAMLYGVGGSGAGGNTTTTTVNIPNITVNTQATDANGVAKGLVNAIPYQFTAQANSGLN